MDELVGCAKSQVLKTLYLQDLKSPPLKTGVIGSN